MNTKKHKEFQDKLVLLGLDFMGKVSGKIADEDIVRLRNAISYRARSFQFHVDLLNKVYEEAVTKANSESNNDLMSTITLMDAPFSLYATFDSVTFHAASLFDYLAGLILYVCDESNSRKCKWSNLANEHNGLFRVGKLKDSTFAPVVIRQHDTWLKYFFKFRAGIIHFEPQYGGSKISHDLMAAKYHLNIQAPKEFINAFSSKVDNSFLVNGNLPLSNAAHWLAGQTIDSALELVNSMKTYIEENRVVKKGREIIQFNK